MNIFGHNATSSSSSQQNVGSLVTVSHSRKNGQCFKKEFSVAFLSKLITYHSVGTGSSAATIEYTTIGGLVKSAMETLVGSAMSAVPVVGPFAAGILTTVPIQLYEYYQVRKISRESAEISNQLEQVGEEIIHNAYSIDYVI